MKRVFRVLSALATCILFLALAPANAYTPRTWLVTSPDHGQTFAYGSEQNRAWGMRGADRHLVLYLNFTNDPYVDRNNPREYDNFTFSFPEVRMGSDGHTFYYHSPEGRRVPVATRRAGFLGIEEIKLLDSCRLAIKKPHGYVSVTLVISAGQ